MYPTWKPIYTHLKIQFSLIKADILLRETKYDQFHAMHKHISTILISLLTCVETQDVKKKANIDYKIQ